MSLRDSLRRATELQVAPPNPCNTQLSRAEDATRFATATQQQGTAPGYNPSFSATPPATGAQQGQLQARNSGQELHVAFASTCNLQLDGLIAHWMPKDQPAVDRDRWCWPHGDAMNTTEIERFLARVKQFIERGIAEDAAERLADELVLADRQPPSPEPSPSSAQAPPARPAARSCAACANLTRRGTCTEPVAAGLAETFGIRWPEPGQGAGCAAYCSP